MSMERRAKHVRFPINKQPQGMIDYGETKSQPISRMMVWQAYARVKANKGGAGMDDMDWEYMEKHQYTEIYKLWNRSPLAVTSRKPSNRLLFQRKEEDNAIQAFQLRLTE